MITIKFSNNMQAIVDSKYLDIITRGMEKAAAMEAAAIKYLEEKNGGKYPNVKTSGR